MPRQTSVMSHRLGSIDYQHTQGGPANIVNTLYRPPNYEYSHLTCQNVPYTSAPPNPYQSDRGPLNYDHSAPQQSASNYQTQQPRTGSYTSQPPNVPSYSTQSGRVAHYGSSGSDSVSSRSNQEPPGSLNHATEWSQWIWDPINGRYYKYRRDAKGELSIS